MKVRETEKEREREEKQLLTIYWNTYLFNLGVSPRARLGASFRTSSDDSRVANWFRQSCHQRRWLEMNLS